MVPARRPQPILTPLTPAAIFLVATIDDGGEQKVHDAFADLSGLVRAVGFRTPAAHLTLVTGIGSNAWDRLFAGSAAGQTAPVRRTRRVPATTRPRRRETCCSTSAPNPWTPVSSSAGASWTRWRVRSRSSTRCTASGSTNNATCSGFVDGTENPDGPEAVEAVQIGQEDPEFAGASYVHVQKYTHDMTAWNALSVPEQERVIGRTKLEDIEFDDAVKPPNSHLALNVITDDDGNELQIVRANMPFGTLGDGASGTYYIAYAADPDVTERMLRNMFIGDPPGNTDRILDFSTAVTGSMFFVPTADFLDDPPPLRRTPSEERPATSPSAPHAPRPTAHSPSAA